MQPEQQQRIMGYFIEEAKDHLNTIEQGLLNLQSTIEDSEMVNEVFRAAHSVKGGAAMLGINSIQKVSHRLEDCFKLLKECPVRVDQRLESLFLRVFDALHELLEQLQGPFGLTEDAASSIMSGIEPVFTELNQHLNTLITQAGGVITADGEVVTTATAATTPAVATPAAPVHQEQSALLLVFQSDVPNQLRAMLQCFKQAESPESRQQLADLCQSLQRMGEQFDLSSWCGLLETSRQAIACSDNDYRTLAPIVIKEIKQAQDLVLANRAAEIRASDQLQALAPVAVEAEAFDFADLLAVGDDFELVATEDTSLTETFDLFEGEISEAELPTEAAIASGEDNALEDLFGVSEAAIPAGDADLMNGIDFPSDSPAHPIADARSGPEVGMAELNSLADLFEGEALDLGMGWQEDEVARDTNPSPEASLDDFSSSEDFSDLLFDEADTSGTAGNATTRDDDLNSLFGDDDLLDDASLDLSDSDTASVAVSEPMIDFETPSDSAALLDAFDLDAQALESQVDLSEPESLDELSAFATLDADASGSTGFDDNLGDLFGSLDESDFAMNGSEADATSEAEDFPNFFESDDAADALTDDLLADSLVSSESEPELADVNLSEPSLEEVDFFAEVAAVEEVSDTSDTDWLTELGASETDDLATAQGEEFSADFATDDSSDLDAIGLFGEEPSPEPIADLLGADTEDLGNLFDLTEEPLNLETESSSTPDLEDEFSFELEAEPDMAAPEAAIADPWENTESTVPNWLDSEAADLDFDLTADLDENDLTTPATDEADLDAGLDFLAEAEQPEDLNDFMGATLEAEDLGLDFATEEPEDLTESFTFAEDDADLGGDLWGNAAEPLELGTEAETPAIADFSDALDLEAASDADWLTDDIALGTSDADNSLADLDTDLWSESSLEVSEPAIAEESSLNFATEDLLEDAPTSELTFDAENLFDEPEAATLELGTEELLFDETQATDLELSTEDLFEDASAADLGLGDWPAATEEAAIPEDLGLDLDSDLGGDLWGEATPAIADLTEPSASATELDFGEQELDLGEPSSREIVDFGADFASEVTTEPAIGDDFDPFTSDPSSIEAVDTFEELALTDNTGEGAEPLDLFAEEPSIESGLFDGLELEAPELTVTEPDLAGAEALDLDLVGIDEFSDLATAEPIAEGVDADLFGTALDFESELDLEPSDISASATPEPADEAIADLDFDLGGLDEAEASPFSLETETVDEAPLDDLFGEPEPSLETDSLFGEPEPSLESNNLLGEPELDLEADSLFADGESEPTLEADSLFDEPESSLDTESLFGEPESNLEVEAFGLGDDELAFDDLLTETPTDESSNNTSNDWLEDLGEADEPVSEAPLEMGEADDLDFGDFAIAATPELDTEDSAEDLFASAAETNEPSDFGGDLEFGDLDLDDLSTDPIAVSPEASDDLDLDFDAIALAEPEPSDTEPETADSGLGDLDFGDLDLVDTEAAIIEESPVTADAADLGDLSDFLDTEPTADSDFDFGPEQITDTEPTADSDFDLGFEQVTDTAEPEDTGLDDLLDLDMGFDSEPSDLSETTAGDNETLDLGSNDELDLFALETDSASSDDETNDLDFFAEETADSTEESFDLFGAEATAINPEETDELDLFGLETTAAEPSDLDFAIAEVDAVIDDSFSDLDSLLADEPGIEAQPETDFGIEPHLDSDISFDDLDALLGDEAPITEATIPSAESSDFSDLEALLDDDIFAGTATNLAAVNSPVSFTGSETTTKADDSSDSEFDDLEKLLDDADQKLGGPPTVKNSRGLAQQANRRQARRPSAGFGEQTMRVPVKHLDNLSNLVGELVVNRNSLEQDQERLRQFLDNLLYQVQQLSDVGQRMRDLYERSLLESSLLANRQSHHASHSGGLAPSHSTGADFDALEMDRFTAFHTLSQEMIELIVRVRESSSDIEFIVDETDQVTRMFRQVTTQLQEGLTRSRMVPFAQIADRLPRAVRDISLKCGKQAELYVEGRETLIDKMILEQLYDPMTHLVNNAIAHGIETPDVRQAAGKPPVGRITIRAFHQGNQTVISVSDDGAGIDPERVRAKAVEKGLITQAESYTLSRLDIYDLLFHPGFTTKDEVTDYAGRGVGMDVVRTSLGEIRGAITTDSAVGKGTTFTIRLPLTLSISKALCCISNRARIAFPMDGVEDMLDVPKERVQTNAEGEPCILWRDLLLPFRPLAEILKYSRYLGRGSVYGGNQEDDIISIVVLRSAGNFIALQVDQVLGEQEIVIKQLEGPVPKPVGVAGATVLGDGRIMPIADVLELIDLSMGRIRRDASTTLWDQTGDQVPAEPAVAKTEPTVLIVDDSITVRELLSMTFNKVGYRVEQARDGQEAWEKLRSGLPCDMVFCDIEMPRMDGLELLSRIQKDPSLSHLPIAMLTSRGADRHRQMAAQLGAKGYFTKPYLEEALLDAAQRMLKGEVLITASTSSNA